VLPVAGNFYRLRIRQGIVGHVLRIRPVLVAGHIVLHKSLTPRRKPGPDPGIICLNREPPAPSVQIIMDFLVVGDPIRGQEDLLFRRDLDD
ncbi:Hypothetical predicted protein, partial [Olea europaea subsp. europaea]